MKRIRIETTNPAPKYVFCPHHGLGPLVETYGRMCPQAFRSPCPGVREVEVTISPTLEEAVRILDEAYGSAPDATWEGSWAGRDDVVPVLAGNDGCEPGEVVRDALGYPKIVINHGASLALTYTVTAEVEAEPSEIGADAS